jgi:hypothetical protein
MARFTLRPTYANVVSTACLVIVVGGSAFAADSLHGAASSDRIYVCVKKSGKTKGQMREVTAKTKCKKSERKAQWAVQGPAGPAGPPGAAGAAGAAGTGGSDPSGQIAYYALSACPAGWSPYDAGQGRYIVGLQSGGTLEGTAGTPLANQEDRPTGQHNHTLHDPGHHHRIMQASPILVGGNVVPSRVMGTTSSSQLTQLPDNPGALQQAISDETTGITIDPAGGVPGTNAPYLQLLTCKKD